MSTDIARLLALYWIARLGSFRAAAARLNVSQPTISVRIKAWENELGLKLFQRRGRSIAITDDGAAVLEYAERIIGLMEDLDRRLGSGSEIRGLIRLGVPDSFALLCLADLLNELDAVHPKLKVAVTVDNSAILSRRLDERALDVAILAEPPRLRQVRLQPLGYHQLIWVASSNGPLKSASYSPRQLSEMRIFVNPPPSNTFNVVMDWFSEHALVPSRISTCNSISAIIELVIKGAGISPLAHSIVAAQLRRGDLAVLPIEPALAIANIFIAHPTASTNPAVPAVVSAIKDIVAQVPFLDGGEAGSTVESRLATKRPAYAAA
jgi:DNA-binding transcriptional LysR family regulator